MLNSARLTNATRVDVALSTNATRTMPSTALPGETICYPETGLGEAMTPNVIHVTPG